MEWKDIKIEKPNCEIPGKHFLITNGETVFIAWSSNAEGYIYLKANGSNKDIIVDDSDGKKLPMTHWIYIQDIPVPNQPERLNPETSVKEDAIV